MEISHGFKTGAIPDPEEVIAWDKKKHILTEKRDGKPVFRSVDPVKQPRETDDYRVLLKDAVGGAHPSGVGLFLAD